VFPIVIPPLRARRDDIPLLAAAFVEREARALHKPLRGLTEAALARLAAYAFPGNVRELHNVIERAAILATGEWIGPAELPDIEGPGSSPPPILLRSEPLLGEGLGWGSPATGPEPALRIEEVERAHIARVLRETGWTIEGPAGAAAALGLHPSTLRSRMARLGIERPPRR
jgi:transcriptional regulator with GAF, ATPase, and Fis domain